MDATLEMWCHNPFLPERSDVVAGRLRRQL
ncbi:MAG: hypothetical protein ACI88S_000733 [Ilumatobacter sp.]|jgi:hypothetical protein